MLQGYMDEMIYMLNLKKNSIEEPIQEKKKNISCFS